MAPIFPTTLALVGDAFPRMTATAMGIVITCGWLGLAVSSPIIGSVSKNLGTALLLIPGFSVIMILVNLALRPLLRGLPTNAAIPVRIDDTKWLYPLVGGVAGAVVGYLTRPSGMLGGQLPFGAVITRGGSLQGLDEVLVPLARQSFNQMAAGTIAGAMLGGVAGAILRRMNPAKPRPQ
jgi:MFS family permease